MSVNRRTRSVPDDRGLRLWNVGWALAVTFVAAVLVAGGVFYGLVALLDFQGIDRKAKLDAKTLFDLVKLSFGVVAGAGALVALVVAYRRQHVDEVGAHREATRLHTERFSQAVDKLGSDSPAVRLGGVHGLAGLADDAPDDSLRQTCIDVLCAYLRLPFPTDPGELPNPLPDDTPPAEVQRETHQDKKDRYHALREVRHTILRLIGDHYRIAHGTHRSWQGCTLDLTGVTIDGDIDFTGATFAKGRVSFDRATFSDGRVSFDRATFVGGRVTFHRTMFAGGRVTFHEAQFTGSGVTFHEAAFSGSKVSFWGATFSGAVSFHDTAVTGGRVGFSSATFSGTVGFDRSAFRDGPVSFHRAQFSGGQVTFHEAQFTGSRVTFYQATFADGLVIFEDATFSGGAVSFDEARFTGGEVSFEHATLSCGELSFEHATLSCGELSFEHATLSGSEVTFEHAAFSGSRVTFHDTTFSGSRVSFDETTGPAPSGLLTAVGTPVPSAIRLRADWLPTSP
ncbi:pentapeptide repeat-containing protein [Streptomyces sp. NPDC005963]|uniref:pentapeptide repeat-containing protein n=1 Tax=Streptomyces sp. NPDC005963 TaxID=3156721 RepID=UPI0033D650BF